MTWLTRYWKVAGILALVMLVFFAGYHLRAKLDEADHAKELAAQIEIQKKAQDEANAKAAAWEIQLAGLRADNKKLTGRLRNEVKNAVYSSCIVPDSGVRIYNDALSGHSTDGSDGVLP